MRYDTESSLVFHQPRYLFALLNQSRHCIRKPSLALVVLEALLANNDGVADILCLLEVKGVAPLVFGHTLQVKSLRNCMFNDVGGIEKVA